MSDWRLSNNTRPAAVAGTFYPRDHDELTQSILQMLQVAATLQPESTTEQTSIRTIIAPHAGYIYSGPIAASAYHYIQPSASTIENVILIGPAHRAAVTTCVCPTARWFETPLGKIPIAQDILEPLVKQKLLYIDQHAHQFEHSLEVHLPFLQTLCSDFTLIPLLVGDCAAQNIVDIISLLQTDNSLLIVSTDLSHFLDYQSANQRDKKTTAAIESLDYSAIGPEDACGCVALSGLLLHAQQQGLHINSVDYRNSGDTAGNKNRVVGYGAYVVTS